MNIYVPTRCIDYYIDAILCSLNPAGHQIMLGDNIVKERNKIDAILINNSKLTDDLEKYLAKNSVKVILINQTDLPPVVETEFKFSPIEQDGYVYLPDFVNVARYQAGMPIEEQKCNLLIVCNNIDETNKIRKIYTDALSRGEHSVKIVGTVFVSSPGFVGMVDNHTLMTYAKSAQTVLVDNKIIRDSMLFYNIYACPLSMADQLLTGVEKDRYVRSNKIKLVTEKKIAEIINEKLGYFNN